MTIMCTLDENDLKKALREWANEKNLPPGQFRIEATIGHDGKVYIKAVLTATSESGNFEGPYR